MIPRPLLTGPPARRISSAARTLVAALVLALAVVLGSALPGSAHDELTGSTPADGATVETAPGEVVLTFSGDLADVGARITVEGPDGDATDGEPTVQGTTMQVPLAADLPAGEYAVTWRATSSDGHPISGRFSFTAAEGAAPSSATTSDDASSSSSSESSTTQTPTTESSATETSTTETSATAAPTSAPASPPAAGSTGGAPTSPAGGPAPWVWVVGLVALGLVLSTLGYSRIRARADQDRPDQPR